MNQRSTLLGILLVAVSMLFVQADRLTSIKEQGGFYTGANRAADLLEEDLLACFPFTGAQEFTMDGNPGNTPDGPLSFVATTVVGATRQVARITYRPLPSGGVERDVQKLGD